MKKLNKTETTAKKVCGIIQQRGQLLFVAEWKKSTYGYCPSIYAWEQKVAYAGGCGYCQESTALANFLKFLFESPSKIEGETYQELKERSINCKIASFAGVGFEALANELKLHGWLLTKNHASETVTAYQIKRK